MAAIGGHASGGHINADIANKGGPQLPRLGYANQVAAIRRPPVATTGIRQPSGCYKEAPSCHDWDTPTKWLLYRGPQLPRLRYANQVAAITRPPVDHGWDTPTKWLLGGTS
ncbi:unnamed protein product [Allacma fusca]|uniref:Uncharacterized protein n=1 Tax=Allacma fusca TaxID=39272 RepID=A0A8J2NSJ8_9HEXA|nr:unnamed protein product [Allacma fusca]